jgi:hypothetical protein
MFQIEMMNVLCYSGNFFLSYSSFLETNVPLLVLIEAAKAGNEKEVEEYALVFTEHANKLVEVSVTLTSSHLLQTGVEYSTPCPSVVLTRHGLKINKCMWGEILLNAQKFKYMWINANSFSLSRCRMWQHMLPRYSVYV